MFRSALRCAARAVQDWASAVAAAGPGIRLEGLCCALGRNRRPHLPPSHSPWGSSCITGLAGNQARTCCGSFQGWLLLQHLCSKTFGKPRDVDSGRKVATPQAINKTEGIVVDRVWESCSQVPTPKLAVGRVDVAPSAIHAAWFLMADPAVKM